MRMGKDAPGHIRVIESQSTLADVGCEKESAIKRIAKFEGNAEEDCCPASDLSISPRKCKKPLVNFWKEGNLSIWDHPAFYHGNLQVCLESSSISEPAKGKATE